MKTKRPFFTLIIFLVISQSYFAYNYVNFQARRLQNIEDWYTLEFKEFETSVKIDGLFYETTLTMNIRLGKEYRWNFNRYLASPPIGFYEFVWNFNLPEDVVISDCKLWDKSKNDFVSAQMIDLSTAEQNYDPNKTSEPQLLMREYRNREYNGSYNNFIELKITPVESTEYKKIQIKFLSPCKMYWDVRRFKMFTRNFYNPYHEWGDYTFPNNDGPAVFKILDKNNPDEKPRNIYGISAEWTKNGDFWQWQAGPDLRNITWLEDVLMRTPEESDDGKYLKTYNDGNYTFYQCAILPDIKYEDRPSRHVIIAVDLKNNQNYLDYMRYPFKYGLSSKDSVLFIVSDFNPKWLGNDFEKMSGELIDQKIEEAKTYDPKLNTLPFILRAAVNKFNQLDKGGEIWLVSDDDNHSETAAQAMEIVDQTVNAAKHPIKFKIADLAYGKNHYINNKSYKGNEYLYENLFRLTGGTFKRYREYPQYDWGDVGMDVFTPTVGVVELEPVPQAGFTYSRVDLNNGRKSFNIVSRFYQMGMYLGELPFDIIYNGNYNENLYRKTFNVNETTVKNECDENVKKYWFTHYIREELLKQPQSYETIEYIEQLAVENNILTPYSGFLLPGVDNYIGFTALTLEDTLSGIDSISTDVAETPKVPMNYSMSAYPNPFNPTTTINIEMGNGVDKQFTVEIYNILGQLIKTYEFNNNRSSVAKIVWNGKNEFGEDVSSGTYLVRYVSNEHIQTIKLLLIR